MTKCLLYFKPEQFYPVPEGTILRYLAHDYDIRTQQWGVVMEVLGYPAKDTVIPQIQFVNSSDKIPGYAKD